MLTLKRKGTRDVIMLTIFHTAKVVSGQIKPGTEVGKLVCILEYNKNIGAFDRCDMPYINNPEIYKMSEINIFLFTGYVDTKWACLVPTNDRKEVAPNRFLITTDKLVEEHKKIDSSYGK